SRFLSNRTGGRLGTIRVITQEKSMGWFGRPYAPAVDIARIRPSWLRQSGDQPALHEVYASRQLAALDGRAQELALTQDQMAGIKHAVHRNARAKLWKHAVVTSMLVPVSVAFTGPFGGLLSLGAAAAKVGLVRTGLGLFEGVHKRDARA